MQPHAKPIIRVIFFFLLLLGLELVTVQAQEPPPRLRVVNASLGIPHADVYVNETLYFESVFYSQISNYVPVDRTNLRLSVLPAGVKDSAPVTERDWNFEDSKDYTMVIVGTAENIEAPWVFEDNNTEPLAPGQARVRMVHAAVTSPALEICVNNRCETLTYLKVSGYTPLDAGTYNLKIRLIGTDALNIGLLPVTFKAGQIYSIFIFDPKQGEVKPRIIPHVDTGQKLPHYPDYPAPYRPDGLGKPHYPPGNVGPPPLYPPVTGTFLSPTALGLIGIILLLLTVSGLWIVRRQFIKT